MLLISQMTHNLAEMIKTMAGIFCRKPEYNFMIWSQYLTQ